MRFAILFGAAIFGAASAHPRVSPRGSGLLSPILPGVSKASSGASSGSVSKRAACSGNTADTRSEWCEYSIDTDYYTGK